MAKIIQGVKTIVKDGKTSYNVYFSEPFADWESDGANTCLGMKCDVEWTNRVDCGFLKVGDEVEFQYDKGFQGKAVLSGIQLVKNAGK